MVVVNIMELVLCLGFNDIRKSFVDHYYGKK